MNKSMDIHSKLMCTSVLLKISYHGIKYLHWKIEMLNCGKSMEKCDRDQTHLKIDGMKSNPKYGPILKKKLTTYIKLDLQCLIIANFIGLCLNRSKYIKPGLHQNF